MYMRDFLSYTILDEMVTHGVFFLGGEAHNTTRQLGRMVVGL